MYTHHGRVHIHRETTDSDMYVPLVLSQLLCLLFHVHSLAPRPYYVSGCTSNHACAYVGQACFEAIYVIMWDLLLGTETLEEVRRKG